MHHHCQVYHFEQSFVMMMVAAAVVGLSTMTIETVMDFVSRRLPLNLHG